MSIVKVNHMPRQDGVAPSLGDLDAYWRTAWSLALPYVARRPLRLRFVRDGRREFRHWAGPPAQLLSAASVNWVSWTRDDGTVVPRPWLDGRTLLEGLLALAAAGGVELHDFGCTVDDLDHPDRLAFNLRPDPHVDWREVVECALRLRTLLGRLGFTAAARVSGGREMHVVVPLGRRRWSWEKALDAARLVAQQLVVTDRLYTTEAGSQDRTGRILIDYRRNFRSNTLIVPYSPVATAGFPVAHPVTWDEVGDGISPTAFTMATVMAEAGATRRPMSRCNSKRPPSGRRPVAKAKDTASRRRPRR